MLPINFSGPWLNPIQRCRKKEFGSTLRSVYELRPNGQTRLEIWCPYTPNKIFRPPAQTQAEPWKKDFDLVFFFEIFSKKISKSKSVFQGSACVWAGALKNLLGVHRHHSCRRVWPFGHISHTDLKKNSNFSKKIKKKTKSKNLFLPVFELGPWNIYWELTWTTALDITPRFPVSLTQTSKKIQTFPKKKKKKTKSIFFDLVFFLVFFEKFEFFSKSLREIWTNGQTRLQLSSLCAPNKFFRALAQSHTEV